MKFKKIVLYDLKSKPLEKDFLNSLKKFTNSIKVVFAKKEYSKGLKQNDLKGADALIVRLFDFYEDNLFEKSNLKYIGAMHTDISHFNLGLLNKKGIILTNVPEYCTESVAELTISALLNISRQTHDAMNFVKRNGWGFEKFMGWELKGKTMGIVGLGKIGFRVAELAQCFGMKVFYFSQTRKAEAEKRGIKFLQLNDLLKQSDVVSLHCNLTKKTKNILNGSNLKLIKKGVILLNSARSELVDLNALYKIYKTKRISAWFEAVEEKTIRDKFRKLDNVYLTPHFGWSTKEAQEKLKETVLNNIKSYLENNLKNKVK